MKKKENTKKFDFTTFEDKDTEKKRGEVFLNTRIFHIFFIAVTLNYGFFTFDFFMDG